MSTAGRPERAVMPSGCRSRNVDRPSECGVFFGGGGLASTWQPDLSGAWERGVGREGSLLSGRRLVTRRWVFFFFFGTIRGKPTGTYSTVYSSKRGTRCLMLGLPMMSAHGLGAHHRHGLVHRGCNEIDKLLHFDRIRPNTTYCMVIDANQNDIKRGETKGKKKRKRRAVCLSACGLF